MQGNTTTKQREYLQTITLKKLLELSVYPIFKLNPNFDPRLLNDKDKLKDLAKLAKDGEKELETFTTNIGGYQIKFSEIEGWEIDISEYVKIGDFVEYKPQTEESEYEFLAQYTGYTDNQVVNKKEFKWR